jgi:predicted alpha/beta hydrolase family esterase
VDVLHGAGHVNPEAGFGPWPAGEAWCYGDSAITSSRMAPG